jgi:hypothetical protein
MSIPGLTPRAIDYRPFGAQEETTPQSIMSHE